MNVAVILYVDISSTSAIVVAVRRSRTNRDDALGGVENAGRHRFVSDADFLEINKVLGTIDNNAEGMPNTVLNYSNV